PLPSLSSLLLSPVPTPALSLEYREMNRHHYGRGRTARILNGFSGWAPPTEELMRRNGQQSINQINSSGTALNLADNHHSPNNISNGQVETPLATGRTDSSSRDGIDADLAIRSETSVPMNPLRIAWEERKRRLQGRNLYESTVMADVSTNRTIVMSSLGEEKKEENKVETPIGMKRNEGWIIQKDHDWEVRNVQSRDLIDKGIKESIDNRIEIPKRADDEYSVKEEKKEE
ncbi:hypothetical protein PFISCL1PPCAC_18555, partial [Pristionchus fissidentatus]